MPPSLGSSVQLLPAVPRALRRVASASLCQHAISPATASAFSPLVAAGRDAYLLLKAGTIAQSTRFDRAAFRIARLHGTVCSAATTMADAAAFPSLKYPKVRRDESVVDDFHGKQIADPYRW
jgi:hypothetical protein